MENADLGQENAIWCESLYLRGFRPSTGEHLTKNQILKFAGTLKNNKIKYAYLFAGPYGTDGHLPDYPFTKEALETIRLIKKNYPEIVILPWIGGIQNATVHLDNAIWVKNALLDTHKLISYLEVPGVHIDFEFITSDLPMFKETRNREKPGQRQEYGTSVNTFHEQLRTLCPNAFISSVVTTTAKDAIQWKRATTVPELEILAKYCNQISFLFYDTSIKSSSKLARACREQIKEIQYLSAKNKSTQYLIAIGTFVNKRELQHYRDMSVENIPNTLQIIKDCLRSTDGKHDVINGIAIFCDWETDENEWQQFYDHWTK